MSQVEDQIARIELKGVAENAHEKFPIRFDYSSGGKAFFTGCRINARFRRYDVVAFDDIAEQLAGVAEGTVLHVKARFQARKGNDEKWYDGWVIEEVLDIE